MIDLHTYLLFIGAVVLLVIVPGPDMAYMLACTVTQGRKAGVLAALGINAGAYVHLTAAVLGLSAILMTSSIAFTAVKWLGACYLIWLGIQTIIAKSGPMVLKGRFARTLCGKTIFWQGLLSDVLNPKVAIFFLAFFPQFIHEGGNDETQQLLLLGVTCNMIAISINLTLICFASSVATSLRNRSNLSAWLHRTMGVVFIALGIRLATEKL